MCLLFLFIITIAIIVINSISFIINIINYIIAIIEESFKLVIEMLIIKIKVSSDASYPKIAKKFIEDSCYLFVTIFTTKFNLIELQFVTIINFIIIALVVIN